MKSFNLLFLRLASVLPVLLCLSVISISAQISVFTYQGRLSDGANSTPTANYDVLFDLYDADAGGNLIGSVTISNLAVVNGVFSASLDFGAAAFDGSERYLELSIRPAGSGEQRAKLQPRQRLTSAPYAVQSKTAATSVNFSGNLSGDVSGTQTVTVVSAVGGETAANVAAATQIANAATSANTANTVVRRDANGDFSAGQITAGNVTLAAGAKLTFADGTQQQTSVDPSLFVVRNVQSGSILVNDNATTINGTNARLTVNSTPSDTQNLTDVALRVRSFAGSNFNVLEDKFRIHQNGGIVARGTLGIGSIPISGGGERMMWHPAKGAFRAGGIATNGTGWDEGNIGYYSWAGGSDTIAKGFYSFAMGANATANGDYSASIGNSTRANGSASIAMGYRSFAEGGYGVALGNRATVCASVTGTGSNVTCNTPFDGVVSISAEKSTDSSIPYLTATADNQFNVRAAGGIRLRTASDLLTGCDIASGNLNCTGAFSANTANSATNVVITGQSSSNTGTWLKLQNSSAGGHTWNIISAGSGNSEGAGNLVILDGNGTGKVVMKTGLSVDGDLTVNGTFNAPVPAGSANYIQNTTSQQASSSFNISGNGTAGGTLSGNTVNASVQYNIGGSRILSSAGTGNLFAGVGAGANNTGSNNTFFGAQAGNANTVHTNNAFFGSRAGFVSIGSGNAFFGGAAGLNNTAGSRNVFVGQFAGLSNTDENDNTFIGGASNGAAGITNATAIGANASVTQSDSVVLGKNANVGIGTSAPTDKLTVKTATSSYGVVQTDGAITVGTYVGGSTGGGWFGTRSNHPLSFFVNDGSPSLTINTSGSITIPGNLSVSGSFSAAAKNFKIDHPLDPANKYLNYTSVESPDMMNIYNGNVTTDEKGEASVKLPDYFEALNRDFRYQLTVIGQFAQAIVAEEIKGNSFKIKTDKPGVKVSWQVTGIRHDKYAEDERTRVEVNKPESERGKCLYEPACGKAQR